MRPYIVLLLYFISATLGDVFSCGGYIRAAVPIDYSKIQVKLFSSEGHLKQEEDVNAQTGYYMLPVYQKGHYSLRVSSRNGFYFEPASFDLKIDGSTDPCSRNEDINFSLTALEIKGVVESGADTGPADLELILLKNKQEIARTTTTAGGHYSFKAPPGTYDVSTAAESSVCISRGKTQVVLKNEPVRVEPPLKISGYPVEIEITKGKAPMEGVSLELYSATKLELDGCKPVSSLPNGVTNAKFVCPLPQTNSRGQSFVKCIVPGNHFIVPNYQSNDLKFQFSPSVITANVQDKKLKLSARIVGFSAKGRVLRGNDGVGGVEVLRDGQMLATTDSQGYYSLENLNEGTIELSARAPNTEFEKLRAQLSFSNARLPDIKLTGYEICGSVEKTPGGSSFEDVTIKGKNVEKTLSPKNDGTFCLMFAPGEYTITPTSSSSSLTPRKLEIDLRKGPRSDLKFFHFKTDVDVRFDCIGSCENHQVKLLLGDNVLYTQSGSDSLVLKEVPPGKYIVQVVETGKVCWSSSKIPLQVDLSRPSPVHFEQTGFHAHVKLSHSTSLKWAHTTRADLQGEFDAKAGRNDFCVPVQGKYTITLHSCRTFDRPSFSIEVPSESGNEAQALDSIIKGTVSVNEPAEITIQVNSPSGKRNVKVENGGFSFREPISSTGQITLVPQSSTHLFEPISTKIEFSGDCIQNAANFQAHKGIFVEGKISPPVEDVLITAEHVKDSSVRFETKTDKRGAYKVGPVRHAEDLSITAFLEGYSFTPVEGKIGDMKSVRLSRLTVVVSELGKEGSRLEGVLLSVVGGTDYRSNSMIENTGTINFVGLAPGDYYVRPILQEFKFEPSQTMAKITEGDHVHVELKGKRVNWSAFGRVREMSGGAVSGALVEALSSTCDQHQSEATTQRDGTFRIRGLKPNCEYIVSIKGGEDGRPAPHCFPSQFKVSMTEQHVDELEMIVAPSDEGFELLAAIDVTGMATPPKAVRLTILRNSEIVHSHILTEPIRLFAVSNLTRDGSTYSVRVEPDRPPRLFHPKEVSFTANTPVKTLTISLLESRKQHEVELSFSSLLSLPFFVLLLWVAFNQNKVIELFRMATNRPGSPSSQASNKKRL
ncbi:unnamed protein product, partial [Mesorhabditis belari]|uniref:Nodal modulator 1 n=1 Tax=Mesorhabditis belari TaxID=2138241 RepID=A0AAF3E9I0_9BILA